MYNFLKNKIRELKQRRLLDQQINYRLEMLTDHTLIARMYMYEVF